MTVNIKKLTTSFNEELISSDISTDEESFYISKSMDLEILVPVKADPIVFKLDEFPEYQNARKLHVVCLGHVSNAVFINENTGHDDYTLQMITSAKLSNLNILAEPFKDQVANNWAVKITATKNPSITDPNIIYPDKILIRIQLYIPWEDIERN